MRPPSFQVPSAPEVHEVHAKSDFFRAVRRVMFNDGKERLGVSVAAVFQHVSNIRDKGLCRLLSPTVIPAQAGINSGWLLESFPYLRQFTPAFAGVTDESVRGEARA